MSQTRILLAEDDSDHQRVLLLALANGRREVDVCVVASRREFLDAISRERFDCVVMDYNLSLVTAPELMREAHSLLGECPVVVVSSSQDQEVVIESMRHGTADFVPKDAAVQGDNLWHRINEAIRKKRTAHADRRRRVRRERRLLKAAETDPLTGLRNRRYLSRVLRSDRFRRDRRQETCCVMLDVDHFKSLNDAYGHDAGDGVLREIARTLRERTARSDCVVRWGGEEFVVLKPSHTLAEGWRWAEEIRDLIHRTPMRCGSTTVNLTASLGVVCLPTREFTEDSLRLADQALYAAKNAGRDRVFTWEMAVANDDAVEARSTAPTVLQRRSAFLQRVANWLGPTQMEYLGPHCESVSHYAERVGRMLEMKPESLDRLRLGGLLHDIGKVAIPESVLAKPGPLNADERALINLHGEIGGDLTEALGTPDDVVALVRDHHARHDSNREWDEELLGAGVLNAVDALVAMTSPRVYRARRTVEEALRELNNERGGQFNPDVIDAINAIHQNQLACAA